MNDNVIIRPQKQFNRTTFQVEWYEDVPGSTVQKRRRKNFKRKDQAENKRQELLLAIERKLARDVLKSQGVRVEKEKQTLQRKTIQEALLNFSEEKKTTSFDLRHHRKEMSNYNIFGEYIIDVKNRDFIDEISLLDLQEWRRSMQEKEPKKLSNSTIERRMNSVRSFLNYCIAHGYIDENPAEKLKKLPIVTPKRKLWKESEKVDVFCTIPEWAQEFWTCLEETLCRPIELCRQTISDIDFENRKCRLLSGKGGVRERWVPLSDRAIIIYRAVITKRRLEFRSKPDDLIFRNSRGNPVTTEVFDKAVRVMREKAGIIKGATPYALRHEGLTNMSKLHIGETTIAAWAGHAKTQTTKHYLQTEVDDLRKVINIRDGQKKKA